MQNLQKQKIKNYNIYNCCSGLGITPMEIINKYRMRGFGTNLNKVDIKDIDIKQLFTSNEHHIRNSIIGHINHSTSQIPYLFNVQCSHYIDLPDLHIFLKMHFGKSEYENKTPLHSLKDKDIEKHINKDEVMEYLHLDYYVYNSIKRSPFLWEWQHGKIF